MQTNIKGLPLFLNSDMVCAVLNGTKTQTRKIVKWPCKSPTHHNSINESEQGPIAAWCPYGQPGDHLWVLETFRYTDDQVVKIKYRTDVDGFVDGSFISFDFVDVTPKCSPSAYTPRDASRILLEITAVRCERLQDISWEDAVAEGYAGYRPTQDEPIDQYRRALPVNGPGAWEANPWVWVLEFKLVEAQ